MFFRVVRPSGQRATSGSMRVVTWLAHSEQEGAGPCACAGGRVRATGKRKESERAASLLLTLVLSADSALSPVPPRRFPPPPLHHGRPRLGRRPIRPARRHQQDQGKKEGGEEERVSFSANKKRARAAADAALLAPPCARRPPYPNLFPTQPPEQGPSRDARPSGGTEAMPHPTLWAPRALTKGTRPPHHPSAPPPPPRSPRRSISRSPSSLGRLHPGPQVPGDPHPGGATAGGHVGRPLQLLARLARVPPGEERGRGREERERARRCENRRGPRGRAVPRRRASGEPPPLLPCVLPRAPRSRPHSRTLCRTRPAGPA